MFFISSFSAFDNDLKSSLDRFIEAAYISTVKVGIDLKSSLDRFIDYTILIGHRRCEAFKIQFG